jgi:hypothetical protein
MVKGEMLSNPSLRKNPFRAATSQTGCWKPEEQPVKTG